MPRMLNVSMLWYNSEAVTSDRKNESKQVVDM